MRFKNIYLISYLLFILVIQVNAQNIHCIPKGQYFGQNPPGLTPEVFMPNIVSTRLDELNSVFSPDGQEFYFCVRNFTGAVSIFQMKENNNNNWSKPTLLPFASRYGDIDVTISPNGEILYFSSKRPLPGSKIPNDDYDLWMVKRNSWNKWVKPIHLGEEINSNNHDFYPMSTKNGTIYFSSQREGVGTNNIYKSELINGKYAKPRQLYEAINTNSQEFDPYISPDENILIFTSTRPEGYGLGDLYISFRDNQGNWTKAMNMGDEINSSGSEFCPMLTPDGKYLFFTSFRRSGDQIPNEPYNYLDFARNHNTMNNGLSNIYWVDAKIIENLKQKSLDEYSM